jgi:hypothetical protein
MNKRNETPNKGSVDDERISLSDKNLRNKEMQDDNESYEIGGSARVEENILVTKEDKKESMSYQLQTNPEDHQNDSSCHNQTKILNAVFEGGEEDDQLDQSCLSASRQTQEKVCPSDPLSEKLHDIGFAAPFGNAAASDFSYLPHHHNTVKLLPGFIFIRGYSLIIPIGIDVVRIS